MGGCEARAVEFCHMVEEHAAEHTAAGRWPASKVHPGGGGVQGLTHHAEASPAHGGLPRPGAVRVTAHTVEEHAAEHTAAGRWSASEGAPGGGGQGLTHHAEASPAHGGPARPGLWSSATRSRGHPAEHTAAGRWPCPKGAARGGAG